MYAENFKTVIKCLRLPFLAVTLANIFLAFALSKNGYAPINYFHLLLILLAALAANISVNALNEYGDYHSGLDNLTNRTPFSGGSGALVENPQASGYVLLVALASLVVTVGVGLYFIAIEGAAILPIGLLGIMIILSYTPWLNRSPLLCLVAPGIAFGPLMVSGTAWVLTGDYSFKVFLVSLVPFFLTNNLLLLNQLPDIDADRSVGRRHLSIVYGVKTTIWVYGTFTMAALLVLLMAIVSGVLPAVSLIATLPLAVAFAVFYRISDGWSDPKQLIPLLGLNVLVAVLTPLVIAVTLLITHTAPVGLY